jgi:sporulation protein YlmC with PRC-barrel domain
MTAFPHTLVAGADVYSSDDHKLGELKRVVVKRSDLTITHIVVDIGFLRSGRSLWEGGLGLDYDRIIPIHEVARSTRNRIDLGITDEQFKAEPEYTDETFEPVADPSPNEVDVNDFALRAESVADAIASTPGAWVTVRLNKDPNSVDIVEGTDVWRLEPHQKLGDVKRVLLDETTGQLRGLVISRGFILKHDVLIPARFIAELEDDIVRLDISDPEIQTLRPYQEGD